MKAAGTAKLEPTDIGLIFYLTLENVCPTEMYISVRGVKCCEVNSVTGINDCNSVRLIGGDPGILCAGKTRNVTLIYPNLYLYGRQGTCTVVVVYKMGMVANHFFHTIPFNTKGSFRDISLPRCPCYTTDLDPFRNCSPVDCPIKYSGHKNFFNTLTKYCEPVPFCRSIPKCDVAVEMYDILHNRCIDIKNTVTSADLSLIEERNTLFYPIPYIFGNMICHQGYLDKKTGNCICFKKWISTVCNEPEYTPSLISSHMCNIRTGSWTELNKDRLLLTILVMVIMTSLCVLKLFFLICILHFCYKWARSRSKKDKKKSTYNLDSGCDTCSSAGSKSKKSKKSKKSSKNYICHEERDWNSIHDILEIPSPKVECKSQGALARTKIVDRACQLDTLQPSRCLCTNEIVQAVGINKQKTASSQTGESDDYPTNLESDSSDSSSGNSETLIQRKTIICPQSKEKISYLSITNTVAFDSSTYESDDLFEGTGASIQTESNYSINMEYDMTDLQLECSSSSED